MAGLPNVGSDSGIWGTELNAFLTVEHNSSTGALLIRSDGTLLTPTAVKSTNYSAQAGDFVPVDTTGGNIVVTLPNAPTKVVKIGVKMVKQGSTNTVTVNCAGSDQFNDDATVSFVLLLLNQGVVFQYLPSAARWYAEGSAFSLGTLDTRYSSTGVMTTLGDTTYENATPTPARLAGNTTATKNFLTQTGTGSVSAAPAWGTIASGDLPTGTTGAKGALQLDGTSGDIQPTGTAAAAGAVGKPSDAGHVHVQTFGGIFGDGSDGTIVLDGTTTFNNFSSLAGSTYTLTRDIFAVNLTVNVAATVVTHGYRIFCQGAFSNAGTLSYPGSNASASTKGAGIGQGTFQNGGAGTAGVVGVGAIPATVNGCIGTGAGGTGGNGTSGAGGSSVAPVLASDFPFRLPTAVLSGIPVGFQSGTVQTPSGAIGGSSGAGDGTNAGGGGGSGGGVIAILAYSATNTGAINAPGGNGGQPAAGNTGGGGGGGGGVIVVYTLTAWTNSGTTNVAGGTAGALRGTGTAGGAGGSGSVLNVVVS